MWTRRAGSGVETTYESTSGDKVHVGDLADVELDLVLVLDHVDVVRGDVALVCERLDDADDAHVHVVADGRKWVQLSPLRFLPKHTLETVRLPAVVRAHLHPLAHVDLACQTTSDMSKGCIF